MQKLTIACIFAASSALAGPANNAKGYGSDYKDMFYREGTLDMQEATEYEYYGDCIGLSQ